MLDLNYGWSSGRLNKKAPKLGAIDLNLLVVFDAIMRDRSVTRAGQRLGLSQPAISHALTRLRHMLKDELFVRSPSGMVPTPRAEELATPIRIALDGLQQSLEPVQFEPSKATTTFRIAVDNYAAIVLVAPIAAHIARIAPGVTLDFRPSGTLNVLDTAGSKRTAFGDGAVRRPGRAIFPQALAARSIRRRASQGSPSGKGAGILDREAGNASPAGNLVCSIRQ